MTFVSALKNIPGDRRPLIVLFLCMLSITGTALADAGKAGWPIFRRAEAANTRGLASTSPGYSSLMGLFYNPAAIAGKKEREALIISESGFIGDKLGGIMYGQPLKNGMIAGGLIGYDAGQIELNWMENGELKSENASAQRDLLGILSWGYQHSDKLQLGASFKAATSNIAERSSAQAYAMDAGVVYQPASGCFVSAAFQNFGLATKFIEKANPLPMTAYVGGGYTASVRDYHLLSGAGVSYNIVDEKTVPQAGFELRYSMISLNVGYKFNTQESMLHMGLGVRWDNVEFGYSYVPGVYLDTTHRMNISYRFSTGGKKANIEEVKAVPVTTVRKTQEVKEVNEVKDVKEVKEAPKPVKRSKPLLRQIKAPLRLSEANR